MPLAALVMDTGGGRILYMTISRTDVRVTPRTQARKRLIERYFSPIVRAAGRNTSVKTALLEVERRFNLSDIMSLRREALGWRFHVQPDKEDEVAVQLTVYGDISSASTAAVAYAGGVSLTGTKVGISQERRQTTMFAPLRSVAADEGPDNCSASANEDSQHKMFPLQYSRPVYHKHQRLYYHLPDPLVEDGRQREAMETDAATVVQQDVLMSRYISKKRPYYDDACVLVREVQLNLRQVVNLNIRLYQANGQDFVAFPYSGGCLVTALHAERANCYTCVLLSKNPNPPFGSLGATDETYEPASAWFDFYAGVSEYIVTWHHPDLQSTLSDVLADTNDINASHRAGNGATSLSYSADAEVSTIIETKHGHHWLGDEHSPHQATLAFSRESGGAMSLHIGCADSILNAYMLLEVQATLKLLFAMIKNRRPYDDEMKNLLYALEAEDEYHSTYGESHSPSKSPSRLSSGGDLKNERGATIDEEDGDGSLFRSLNDSLEPASANMFLFNMVVGAEIKIFNLDIVLHAAAPRKDSPLPGSTFPACVLKVNASLRVLSGQEKENFKFECNNLRMGLGECTTTNFHQQSAWNPPLVSWRDACGACIHNGSTDGQIHMPYRGCASGPLDVDRI